jgi:LysR family transcriptional activator of nhaA
MFNFNHLYYFYVTAKSGGVTCAARHLHLSQPSLSSQLKVLEGSLDVKLFEKNGRRNELTGVGHVVFDYCRKMFELSEAMDEVVAKKMPMETKRISIGISEEVDRSFVVEVVSGLLKKLSPDQRPKVALISAGKEQLADRLRFRELDAVVTETPMVDIDFINLDHVEVPVILTCPFYWKTKAVNKKNSAIGMVRDFLGEAEPQWVVPNAKFKLRSEIDHFIEENSMQGKIVFESDTLSTLASAIKSEIGFSFLPAFYVVNELRLKSLKRIGPKEGFWKYPLWLVANHLNKDDFLINEFSHSFRTVCNSEF